MNPSVRRWIGLLAVAATAGVVGAASNLPVRPPSLEAWVSTVVLGIALAVATALPLPWRSSSGSGHLVTLGEAVLLVLLVAAPLGVVPIVVVLATLVDGRRRGASGMKVVYNVAAATFSTCVAVAIVAATTAQVEVSSLVLLLVAGIAAAIANVVELFLLAELFRRLDGQSVREFLQVSGFAGTAMAVNLLTGMTLGGAVLTDPLLSVLGVGIIALLGIGMRDHGQVVEANAQSLRLHELTRLVGDVRNVEGLHRSVLADGDADAAPDVEPLLASIANVFGASRLHLLVVDDEGRPTHRVFGESGGRLEDDEVPPELAEAARSGESVTMGTRAIGVADLAAMVSPLAGEHFRGAIGLYARVGAGTWGERDAALLDVLARHVSTSLGNRRLLDDVERERALVAVESAKLGDIVTAASDGIALVARSGRIRTFNPGFERLTGLAAGDVIGRPWVEMVVARELGSDTPLEPDAWRQWFGAGTTVEVDLDVRRADGWRRTRCALSPVRASDGTIDGVVLVARDRTAEAEIEQLKADFVAVVSHELRTPLTPLQGFVTTLQRRADGLDARQVQTMADAMARQLGRLDALVADLLTVADLDRGLATGAASQVDLATLVEEAVDAEVEATATAVDLQVEGDTEVRTDPAAVERIVRALVSNAVKHGAGPVQVRLVVAGGGVTIEVRDEGPGVPVDQRDAIFESFRRVGTHLEWSTQGPGLGLAIARGLAARLGGTLDLLDVPVGAAFRLALPVAPGADAAASTADQPLDARAW